MNTEKIQSIKLALMEIIEDINLDSKKSDYIIRSSATFNLEIVDFKKTEEIIQAIINDMYIDLTNYSEINKSTNFVGVWVKYDGEIFDNAIRTQTLEDINKYSPENVDSLYEFLKMTLPEKE